MSLSPYINPTNLNGALTSSNKLGEHVYPNGLDKRTTGLSQFRRGVTDISDTIKDVSDSIENLSGVRSPLYIIGEIPSEDNQNNVTQYIPDQLSGLIRAVSSVTTDLYNGKPEQAGVIIDGIGDVTATLEVEFSKNPNVFRTSEVTNNRVRKPARLSMTVFVSNYLK